MWYRGTKAVVLVSSCALFGASCTDSTLSSDVAAPRLYDGTVMERAVFRNADEMMATVGKRLEMPTEVLVAMEREQKYPSLRAYLDPNEWTEETAAAGKGSEEATGSEGIALKEDGVVRGDFELSDAILSVLNQRGEIQIADSVYKLTRDNVYAVAPENVELLSRMVPTLSSPAPADKDDRISVTPLETTREATEGEARLNRVTAPERPSFYNLSSTASCMVGNSSERNHGKAYITNALFYSEAGVKTDWEKKKWFGWSNTWTGHTLYVSYNTNNLKKGSNWVSPSSGSAQKQGTASVRMVITSGGFVTIRGNISSSHGSSNGWWCNNYVSRP
jgi:hypothetical protein